MIGWNPGYNWTHEQYKKVVDRYLVRENQDSVTLDTEHADYHNEQQILTWAKADGYDAEVLRSGDIIKISKK